MYPTVTQSASNFVPFTPTTPIRTYVIDNGGHGYHSLYAMFQMPGLAGAWWGSRRPASPTRRSSRTPTTTKEARRPHVPVLLQRPAPAPRRVRLPQPRYWVINTLLDDLTNPEMVAIARSLKPTG